MMNDVHVGEVVVASKKLKVNSTEYFEREISIQWQKAVESIIAVGKLLNEAYAELGIKGFQKLCKKLGMKTRTQQRLRQIADYKPFEDASVLTHLPNSYTTLVAITQLSEEQFDEAIQNKSVNPESTTASVTSYIKQVNNAQTIAAPRQQTEMKACTVYIDTNSLDYASAKELEELLRDINSRKGVRVEFDAKCSKALTHKFDSQLGGLHMFELKLDMEKERDRLIEEAEKRADREDKSFEDITGYRRPDLYDFVPAAALKALGANLLEFGMRPPISDMTPYELQAEFVCDYRR